MSSEPGREYAHAAVPIPPHGSTGVLPSADFMFLQGSSAASHSVYLAAAGEELVKIGEPIKWDSEEATAAFAASQKDALTVNTASPKPQAPNAASPARSPPMPCSARPSRTTRRRPATTSALRAWGSGSNQMHVCKPFQQMITNALP